MVIIRLVTVVSSIQSVRTVIQRGRVGTNRNLENILITQEERATLTHDEYTRISYKRINHVPYIYKILIDNPQRIEKKVIVRLWLGLSTNLTDPRSSQLSKHKSQCLIINIIVLLWIQR